MMKDEPLLELKKQIIALENKDASYVVGFSTAFEVIADVYNEHGTELQKCLLEYLKDDLKKIYTIKSEHGKFKHVVK